MLCCDSDNKNIVLSLNCHKYIYILNSKQTNVSHLEVVALLTAGRFLGTHHHPPPSQKGDIAGRDETWAKQPTPVVSKPA